MRRFNALNDLVPYILRKHPFLGSTRGGVEAYKFIRKLDGRRIPFEHMHGFRIFDMGAFDQNTLVVDQIAAGYEFKKHKKCTVSSKLFLTNLALVNIYDVRAEFFSWDSIDFSYVENEHMTSIHMLHEWQRGDPGILRAQWICENDSVDKLLERLGVGDQDVLMSYGPRLIDMETE